MDGVAEVKYNKRKVRQKVRSCSTENSHKVAVQGKLVI